VVGDFDDDGNEDLAITNQGSDDVSVLLGTGTGSFGPAANVRVGGAPSSIAVADLDKDHNADLAVGNLSSGDVSILLGTGAGAS
jgi:hypothetical protein